MVSTRIYRSSHQRCSVRKGALRNFTKFTGKHPCQSLFFDKVAGLRKTPVPECLFCLAQVFSSEFCEIFKNTFLTEHLWATASTLNRVDPFHDTRSNNTRFMHKSCFSWHGMNRLTGAGRSLYRIEMFCVMDVLKSCTKVTGKQLCRSLFKQSCKPPTSLK